MKKNIIFGGIVLIIVAILVGGYYFTTTPRYSLYQIRKAIKNHDSISFNKYVDVDRLVSEIVSQSEADLQKELEGNPFAAMAQGMMAGFKDQLKQKITKGVEDISESEGKSVADAKIQSIKREGKSAEVSLINTEGEIFRVSMIQTPEKYWRITSINNDDWKKVTKGDDTSASSEKQEKNAVFGEEISIGGDWVIVINAAEEYISDNTFIQPKDGNKFVALQVEYINNTDLSDSVDPTNFTLRDSQGQSFSQTTYPEKEPAINYDSVVPAHGNLKGYITYEVPKQLDSYKVLYSNNSVTVLIQ